MNLSTHCKNVCEQTNVEKLKCYGNLSHMLLFFIIKDEGAIGLKKIGLLKSKKSSSYEG